MYSFVRQLLKAKAHHVWAISPQKTVYEALQLMAEKNIGALVVIDHGKVVGVFSERDYARKCILKGKHSQDTPVSELMSKEVVSVSPEESIQNCMTLMTTKRARHIPVVESGKLVGVISIGDIVKAVIDDREFTIQELERYITGT